MESSWRLAEKIYKAYSNIGGLFQQAQEEFPGYNSSNDAADELTIWVVEQLIGAADENKKLKFDSGSLSEKESSDLFDALFLYVHERFPYS